MERERSVNRIRDCERNGKDGQVRNEMMTTDDEINEIMKCDLRKRGRLPMGSSESLNDVMNPAKCLCDTGRVLNNVSPKTDRLTNKPQANNPEKRKSEILRNDKRKIMKRKSE